MNAIVDSSGIHSVSADRGAAWLGGGWSLFKAAPGVWIVLMIVSFVAVAVVHLLPFGSLLAALLVPILGGGLMLACKQQEATGILAIETLLEAFKSPHLPSLAVLGVLSLVGSALIGVVVTTFLGAGFGIAMFAGHAGQSIDGIGLLSIMAGLLIGLLLYVPLSMALWFSPALIVLRGMNPVDAAKLSFNGCMQNIVPFLIYDLLAMVMILIAIIPAGFGLLIAIPVLSASGYFGYKDIFGDTP